MNIVGAVIFLLGMLFVALAGLGLYRMPNFFSRMQATSKAATLGILLSLLGSSIVHPSYESFSKAFLVAITLLLTAPIATHALTKAAYRKMKP